ncbi:MAG: PAS domain S-box protein [Parvularculaceae bacterium]
MIAELQTAISNTPVRRRVEQHLSAGDKVKIRAERMALLLRGAPIEIGIGIINAVLVVFIAWKGVDHGVLRLWGGLALGLAFARFLFWFSFSRGAPQAHALASYARWHIAGMGLTGALWGALGPIFAMHGMLGDALLPFMIAAMTATALASAGASWRAVLAFTIPALLPFSAAYALMAGANGPIFAIVVVLYAAAIAYLAWSTQEMIQRSIRLRSRNDRLLEALKKQVDAAHEAEKRYRGLVESSQDLTLIFSPEGRIVYASPSINGALGSPAATFIGKSTRDVVHPDDLPLFRAVGEKSLSKLGEVIPLPHVCLKASDGSFAAFGGRLTNMLYVPGVDGFVFSGGRAAHREILHAAE